MSQKCHKALRETPFRTNGKPARRSARASHPDARASHPDARASHPDERASRPGERASRRSERASRRNERASRRNERASRRDEKTAHKCPRPWDKSGITTRPNNPIFCVALSFSYHPLLSYLYSIVNGKTTPTSRTSPTRSGVGGGPGGGCFCFYPTIAFLLYFLSPLPQQCCGIAPPSVPFAATSLQRSLSATNIGSHCIQQKAHIAGKWEAPVLVRPRGKNEEAAFGAGVVILVPRMGELIEAPR